MYFLGKITQIMKSRGLQTSSMEWCVSIPNTPFRWKGENMAPASWNHGSCMPGCNCTKSWRLSHGVKCLRLEFLSTLVLIPTSPNSVRRFTGPSPACIYAFLSSTWKLGIQPDNSSSNRSQLVTALLDEHSCDLSVMDWPARSIFLNPIELFCVDLEKYVKSRLTHQWLLQNYGKF